MRLSAAALILGFSILGQGQGATLIHQYGFAADASDSVGGAHGTLNGGAAVTSGYLSLDGNDDYVQFASYLVPTSGSYSVALFAQNLGSVNRFTELISQGSSGGPGFYIGTEPGTGIRVSDSWLSTGEVYPAGTDWHHFAVVVNSVAGTSDLYINGVLEASLGFAIATTGSGTATRLGNQFGGFSEYFQGNIDDVRIYTGALSAREVNDLASGVPEPGTIGLLAGGLLFGWVRLKTQPTPKK